MVSGIPSRRHLEGLAPIYRQGESCTSKGYIFDENMEARNNRRFPPLDEKINITEFTSMTEQVIFPQIEKESPSEPPPLVAVVANEIVRCTDRWT